MSWQWRWHVDDDAAPKERKVVPLRRHGDQAVESPRNGEDAALRELTDAIREAVKGAEWLPEQQDLVAVQDERAFKQRFGFDVNRFQRQQVIAFKYEADVTDTEIRILRKSGSLIFAEAKIDILAPRGIAWWGHVQNGLLAIMMALPLLAWGSKPVKSLWAIAAAVLVEAMLLYFIKLSDDMYIRPHRIRKRVLQHLRRGRN